MLITLEGLDGSGKTTAWNRLRDRYPDAVFTREPTDSWYGEAVRRSLADESADPLAELFLYCADHANHLTDTVRPALERGGLVIADRYVDSRIAYQGHSIEGHVEDPLEYVSAVHRPFTILPDLTCFLEVDIETALARGDRETKFERGRFLDAVARNYDRLVEDDPERFVVIDAEREPRAVVDAIVGAIEARRQDD